ncbi:MAG: hypothetical protein ACFWT3_13215 [Pseudomonas lundensis]
MLIICAFGQALFLSPAFYARFTAMCLRVYTRPFKYAA